MKYKQAEIKISIDGFKNCPPRRIITDELRNIYDDIDKFEIVNTERKNWKNESDTLVMIVNSLVNALLIGKFATIFGVDEFDFVYATDYNKNNFTDGYIVRLWWDKNYEKSNK